MNIFGKQRLGIDLGSANTIIYIANKGIALREPSIVALDKNTQEIVAFGKEASKLVGRTSDNYETIYPIRNGVIANFTLTKQMLAHFINQALNRSFGKPEVVICAPSKISKVERKAIIDAIRDLGINRAMIIEEPFAAAVGADLEIEEARGKMVVDIGGGTTDIATISYGEIIQSLTLTAAGSSMNEAIQAHVRQAYQLIIGDYTAETLKIVIGNADYAKEDLSDKLMVKGRSITMGVPGEANVESEVIAHAIDEIINQIINAIKQVLEQTPPELSADIMETGIVLTGGGALLKRLPERLEREIGLPVRLADKPIDAVAIGAGLLLNEMNRRSEIIEKKSRR